MADALAEFLRRQGLGRIEEQIALGGSLSLSNGGEAQACLVHTTCGVYLAGAADAQRGSAVPLSAEARLVSGRLRDTLRFQGRSYQVPMGSAGRVRAMIGLSRFASVAAGQLITSSRFIEPLDTVTRALLRSELSEADALLAYLATDLSLSVPSQVLGSEVDAMAHFMLTTTRAALVCVLDVGDTRIDPLDLATLRVESERGRAIVTTAAFRFRSTRHNSEMFPELVAAVSKAGADRELEIARLCFVARSDKDSDRAALALLARLSKQKDLRALVLETALALELDTRVPALPDLAGGDLSPEAFAGLWSDFQLSPETGLALLERTRRSGASAHALALHRAVHERLAELRQDAFHLAEADAALAQHLIEAGARGEARTLIKERLASMPRDVESELLPNSHADLTTGAASRHRVRLLELLAQTKEDGDAEAVAALAVLEPLVPERIDALVRVASADTRQRALSVQRLLAEGSLTAQPGQLSAEVQPIEESVVDETLRHPAARAGSDILGRLQAMLAAVPVPDQTALRDYVEPLTEKAHPEAARALRRAAKLLGVPGVEGYISRGRKGVGVRSYEGHAPFVLLGGRHLDADDPAHMTELELCFAIATEVAHVRYGHSRVTSSEVWAGALGKSKEGLDLALGMLPLFRGVKMLQQVTRVTDQVPFGAIRRTVRGGVALRKGLIEPKSKRRGDEPAEGLSALNEQLVAAHRLMQLTADRAGLVACGDPVSALRAMLLVRTDLHALLEQVLLDGLDPVLATRDDHGVLVHQDMAIRASQLLSFYLSEDYAKLRHDPA